MLPACRTAGDEFTIPTFDLTPRDVAGFTDELQEFQGLFHDCFPRSEPRAHFFDYPYSDTSRTCAPSTRIYECIKGRFPSSLATAKP